MRITWALLGLTILTASACGSPDTALVLVNVKTPSKISLVTSVDVEIGNNSRKFPVMGLGPETLVRGVYIKDGYGTRSRVSVIAKGAGSCPRWLGEAELTLPSKGDTVEVTINLGPDEACMSSQQQPVDAGRVATATDGGTVPFGAGPEAGLPAPLDVRPGSEAGADLTATRDTGPVTPPQPDAFPVMDMSVDRATPDAPIAPPDTSPDVPAPVVTPPTLQQCNEYDHVVKCDVPNSIGTWALRSLKFTPDGTRLVTAAEDGRIKVWKVVGATLVDEGRLYTSDRQARIDISPDGKLLAAGSENGQLRIIELATGFDYATLTGHNGNIYAVAFSVDGKFLFTADSDKILKVWQVGTKTEIRSFTLPSLSGTISVDPKGTDASAWIAAGLEKGIVWMVDMRAASPVPKTFSIVAPAGDAGAVDRPDVYAVAFSPDGKFLAIGDYDGKANLWDVSDKANPTNTGGPLLVSPPYARILALAFFPDGRHFVAANSGDRGEVRLVSLQSRSQKASRAPTWTPTSIAVSPDGMAIAAGQYNCGKIIYCRN